MIQTDRSPLLWPPSNAGKIASNAPRVTRMQTARDLQHKAAGAAPQRMPCRATHREELRQNRMARLAAQARCAIVTGNLPFLFLPKGTEQPFLVSRVARLRYGAEGYPGHCTYEAGVGRPDPGPVHETAVANRALGRTEARQHVAGGGGRARLPLAARANLAGKEIDAALCLQRTDQLHDDKASLVLPPHRCL